MAARCGAHGRRHGRRARRAERQASPAGRVVDRRQLTHLEGEVEVSCVEDPDGAAQQLQCEYVSGCPGRGLCSCRSQRERRKSSANWASAMQVGPCPDPSASNLLQVLLIMTQLPVATVVTWPPWS